MGIAGKLWRWHWIPAAVLLIGIMSIILLLWVERISDRLHVDEMLIDSIMDIQIRIATAHLRLEEIIRGEPEVDVSKVIEEMDHAIQMISVILDGGRSEKEDWIFEPLRDPGLRSRVEAIRSLLIRFRTTGIERLQELRTPEKRADIYQQFHAVFKECLSRARELEESIEKDEAVNQKKAKRLFLGIPAIWTIIVIAAAAGLWNRERQRRKGVEDLLKANEQLLSQAEELTAHREHLADLVDSRTAELAGVNARLRAEIAERTQTEAALKESEGQLRLLSSRLMTAQETERKAISRELHDELGHALTIVKLKLKSIERGMPDQDGIRDDCEDIMNYIDQTIENVRRLSRDLSPAILEDLGLTAAVRWLVDNFNMNFDGKIRLDMSEIDSYFSEEASIMIYRILQEALTNIGKHADAGDVSVTVRRTEGMVSFLVEDDGRGFTPPSSFIGGPAGKNMGLAIMAERVRMLMGTLELQSHEGRGTRIFFTIPTQKE